MSSKYPAPKLACKCNAMLTASQVYELKKQSFYYIDHAIEDEVQSREMPMWIGAVERRPE